MWILLLSVVTCLTSQLYVQAADCPETYCKCSSVSLWNCQIRSFEQIACGTLNRDMNGIIVMLRFHQSTVNRKTSIFTEIQGCEIKRMMITTNIIPSNDLIGNLSPLENLILQDDSKVPLMNYASNIENLLSGLKELKRMKIENLKIRNWSSSILESCPSVEKIELKNLRIENFDFKSFSNCKNLIDLVITFNRVLKLFVPSFSGLTELRTLVLSRNEIEQIVTNEIGWWELRNLTKLDLSQNSLSRLPAKSFIGLKKLNNLILTDNKIEFIENLAFDGLDNLKVLSLQNNKNLILFDILILVPVQKSIVSLYVDTSSIQCVDHKSHLSNLHQTVQTNLRSFRDCNKGTDSSPNLITSSSTLQYHSQEPKVSNAYTIAITMAVLITILIMGIVFFIYYFIRNRRKIQKFKTSLSLKSFNSPPYTPSYSQNQDVPMYSECTMTFSKDLPSIDHVGNGTNKLIPRYKSSPILNNI